MKDNWQQASRELEETIAALKIEIEHRKIMQRTLRQSEDLYRSLFEKNRTVILLIDPETGAIFDANPAAAAYYGYDRQMLTKMHMGDINTLSEKAILSDMASARSETRNYFNFRHRLKDGTIRDVEVFSGPIRVGGKALLCSIVHDIMERKTLEKDREELIAKLKKALTEVKTLRGFLPICSACKKIRDDKGYWNQIESYVREHSEAEFSHSICPECLHKLYPDCGPTVK
jgi:PAS domain S-box-containing protein